MINRKSYYLLYGVVLSGLIASIVFLGSVNPDTRDAIVKEGGAVESLSAIGYFICAILLFLIGRNHKSYWYLMLVLFAFGLRELDFHNRFTTMSLLKTKFYVSPDVPVMEKIIGAAVILLLLYSFFHLIKNHFRDLMSAIKQMEPYAIGAFFGIFLLFLTETLDGLARKLASIDITIGNDMNRLSSNIEEILELGIPLMFMIAIMARFRKS